MTKIWVISLFRFNLLQKPSFCFILFLFPFLSSEDSLVEVTAEIFALLGFFSVIISTCWESSSFWFLNYFYIIFCWTSNFHCLLWMVQYKTTSKICLRNLLQNVMSCIFPFLFPKDICMLCVTVMKNHPIFK